MFKPIVVFDFDGVIHSYTSGWKGMDVIPDPPVKGVKEFIQELRKTYQVFVFSTRCAKPEGINAIREYLEKYEIIVDGVVDHKPPAFITIDDRTICFTGEKHFETLMEEILKFKPWNKR
jgi:hypothetical protein